MLNLRHCLKKEYQKVCRPHFLGGFSQFHLYWLFLYNFFSLLYLHICMGVLRSMYRTSFLVQVYGLLNSSVTCVHNHILGD